MASRMERYYNEDDVNKRSRKNSDLYQKIYDEDSYTNIEGIANIEKTNEIDITKIKELLKSRENYQKSKQYLKLINGDYKVDHDINDDGDDDADRTYDINDVLTKAHCERDCKPEYYSLKNTQFNILKNIKLDDDLLPPKIEDEEELRELINTITSTSMLNKLGDKELSLDILDELKASGDTIINSSAIARSIPEKTADKTKEDIQLDKSFFTTGFSLSSKDFEDADMKNISKKIDKNNRLIKLTFIVLAFALLFIGLFIIWIMKK